MARRDRDRNEVEIDLEKYMALLDQLDDQEDVKKKTGHDAGEKAVMNIMGNHMGQRRPPVNPINSEEKAQLRSLIESFGWPLP